MNQGMKNGLKCLLLCKMLPLLVVSLAIVTLWSGFWSLYGASRGGMHWTHATLEVLNVAMKQMENEFDFRAGIHARQSGSADVILKQGESARDAGDPASKIKRSGYYRIREGVVYASMQENRSGARLVYLKKLDDGYVNKAAELTANEVLLVSGNAVVASTIKDGSGRTQYPSLSPETVESLMELHPGGIASGKSEYRLSNYAGFRTAEGFFYKGANSFQAFDSYFPISDPEGSVIGYLGVLVPADALLHSPKKAIWGDVIMLAFLALIGIFLTVHIANRLVEPLSRSIIEIDKISMKFSASSEMRFDSSSGDEAVYEMNVLAHSIRNLRDAHTKWMEMAANVESERARSSFTAKMAALGEMAAGIAHEINSPLAIITMLSSQMRELTEERDLDRKTLLKMETTVESTATRIGRIVKALRMFARDGKLEQLSSTTVESIVENAFVLCTERFKHAEIMFNSDIMPKEIRVDCCTTQITQVIVNLLNNAYDAVKDRDQKWITVSGRDLGDKVEISVSDSGSGIPKNVREKLFLPFFTTKDVSHGTGLGLSISQEIITAHHGSLRLDKDSSNTRFVAALPKKQFLQSANNKGKEEYAQQNNSTGGG